MFIITFDLQIDLAMARMHDRQNVGKIVLSFEKQPVDREAMKKQEAEKKEPEAKKAEDSKVEEAKAAK